MNKRAKASSIRIIAGRWRGRRLPVVDSPGLRPSTDRVRETVFNWLMHDIAGSRCLDLFAGTGALGLECLSRGATFVQFVESQANVSDVLQQNLQTLDVNPERARCVDLDALRVLANGFDQPFDLVFLDPPYASDLLTQSIVSLAQANALRENAMVYIERDVKSSAPELPSNWSLYREGVAGQSHYALYQV